MKRALLILALLMGAFYSQDAQSWHWYHYSPQCDSGIGWWSACDENWPNATSLGCPDGANTQGDGVCVCDSATNPLEHGLIGWGLNCALPLGGGDSYTNTSNKSIVPAGNIIGEVLDTEYTLGIAVAMREEFCTFSPGNPYLEGGFVDRQIISKHCGNVPDAQKAKCIQCLYSGRGFDSGATPNSHPKCTSNGAGILFPAPDNPDDQDSLPTIPYKQLCQSGIPNPDKPLLNNGKPVYGGPSQNVPVFCPMMRGNIPTNYIKAKYFDSQQMRFIMMLLMGPVPIPVRIAAMATPDICDVKALSDGTTAGVAIWEIVQLNGQQNADQICARMLFPTGWTTLACKASVPPVVNFPDLPCLVSGNACSGSKSDSQWILPITSRIMECVTGIFNDLFGGGKCPSHALVQFQGNMKNIVKVMLILYVAIFGIQLMFGADISKKTFFTFILRFALVVYFAVGDLSVEPSSSNDNQNGLLLIKDVALSGMSSFSSMIMYAASSSDGFCNFDPTSYPAGSDYLSLWDSLDCRLSFYIGMTLPDIGGYNSVANGGGASALGKGVLKMAWGFFFSFNVVSMVFLLAFAIFLLSLVVYFVHLYILAMIAVSVLIFFGPIFIPLALFEPTKSFCDKWIGLVLGYALQPVIIITAIAVMFSTFDKIMYTDCTFFKKMLGVTGEQTYPYWILNDTQSTACQHSLGYQLASTVFGKSQVTKSFFGIVDYFAIDPIIFSSQYWIIFLESLMLVTFFAFLFYFFSQQLDALAQEISGAPGLGKFAAKPMGVVDKAKSLRPPQKAKSTSEQKGSGSSASRDGVLDSAALGVAIGAGIAAGLQPFSPPLMSS